MQISELVGKVYWQLFTELHEFDFVDREGMLFEQLGDEILTQLAGFFFAH
jgi:broad specificity phosphatase PhoE